MEVTLRRRIWDGHPEEVQVAHGLTLDLMLDAAGWERELRPFTAILVNGRTVPREWWSRVRPREGARLTVALMPQGGQGGGKQILTVLAAIVLVVVGNVAGGYAAGTLLGLQAGSAAYMVVSGVVAAAVSAIGMLAMNALIRPPALAKPTFDGTASGDSMAESQAYGLSGQRNQANPYGTTPRIFGAARVTPNVAAEPVIFTNGRYQELRAIYDVGYGPLDIWDLRIGDSPLGLFRDVSAVTHAAWRSGDNLQLYWGVNSTVPLNRVLDTSFQSVMASSSGVDEARMEFSFPAGLATIDRRGNPFWFTVGLEIGVQFADVPGAPVQPLTDFAHSVSWDQTGLGSLVVAGMLSLATGEVATNPGPFVPTAIFLPDDVTNLYQPIVGDVAVFQDGFRSTVTAVLGYNPNNSTTDPNYLDRRPFWTVAMAPDPAAHFGPEQRRIALFQRQVAPGSTSVNITAATRAPFVAVVTVRGLGGRPVLLHARRVLPQATAVTITDQVTWTALSSILYRAPIQPRVPHALIELRVQASDQLSGVVDTLSCLVTSHLPYWTGGDSYAYAPSRSPAWAYVEALIGSANPRPVAPSMIDWPRLFAWASWCASTSPQGDQMATCDLILDARAPLGEVLQTIAATGQATPAFRDGKYSIIAEVEPRDPVQVFSARNARNMQSQRLFVTPPDALRVRYVNEGSQQREEVLVFADGQSEATAARYETLDLLGVTRIWQAWRAGRYYLAAMQLRRERFTFETDIESLVCQRGDLVLFQSDTLRAGGVPVRVRAVLSGTEVAVDEILDALPDSPAVLIRSPGGLRTSAVALVDPTTLAIDSTADLAPGMLLVVGSNTVTTLRLVVDKITPGPDLSATVECMEEAPGILSAASGPIPDYIPPQAAGFPSANVVDLRIGLAEIYPDGDPFYRVTLKWGLSNSAIARSFSIAIEEPFNADRASLPQGQVWWREIGTTTGQHFTLDLSRLDLPQGGSIGRFKVEGLTAAGRRIGPAIAEVQLLRDTTAPPVVPFFSTNVQSETVLLTWSPYPPDQVLDLALYELRFSEDPLAPWDRMTTVIQQCGPTTLSAVSHARTGRYAIAPLDTSGNYGEPAYSNTWIETLPNIDLVEDFEGAPAWTGTHAGTEVVGGELRLALQADGTYPEEGWWYAGVNPLYPGDQTVRLSGIVDAYGASLDWVLEDWVPIAAANPIGTALEGRDWTAEVFVRIFGDAPTLDDPYFDPLATADPLAGGAESSPWTRLISSDFFMHQAEWAIRLRSLTPGITPSLQGGFLRVDVAERREFGADLSVPIGGAFVPFARAFWAPPSVAITINAGASGDRIMRTATRQGFDVEIFNAAGDSVARSIDWAALGYGSGTA